MSGDAARRRDRIEALLRELAGLIAEPIAVGGSRWMRATSSPLGARLLRRLIREGVIASARPAKFLLVDRIQHDEWISKHAHDHAPAPKIATNGDDEDGGPLCEAILRGGGRH